MRDRILRHEDKYRSVQYKHEALYHYDADIMKKTEHYTGTTMQLAINYGGKDEIKKAQHRWRCSLFVMYRQRWRNTPTLPYKQRNRHAVYDMRIENAELKERINNEIPEGFIPQSPLICPYGLLSKSKTTTSKYFSSTHVGLCLPCLPSETDSMYVPLTFLCPLSGPIFSIITPLLVLLFACSCEKKRNFVTTSFNTMKKYLLCFLLSCSLVSGARPTLRSDMFRCYQFSSDGKGFYDLKQSKDDFDFSQYDEKLERWEEYAQ